MFVCSPVRYRRDAPAALAVAVASWPGRPFLVVDGSLPDDLPGVDTLRVELAAPEDSREIGGPRSTGETQENIAFLRNKCFRAWSQTAAPWCFMVDSDVVLAPNALEVALATMATLPPLSTLSLQIDNRVSEDHPPASNAMDEHGRPIPYRTDGSLVEVARSGACTLYPRAALGFRFHWQPGYNEEHQWMFDQMRAAGWRHFLLQAPELADHRMPRLRSGFDLVRERRAQRQRQDDQ